MYWTVTAKGKGGDVALLAVGFKDFCDGIFLLMLPTVTYLVIKRQHS